MRRLVVPLALALASLGCPDQAKDGAPSSAQDAPAAEPGPSSQPAIGDEARQPSGDGTTGAAPTGVDRGMTVGARDQVDDDGVVRRGEALTSAAPLSVQDCAARASELHGKPVKLTGTVEQVCAKKGCWWVLAGDGTKETIRITAKGYGFFVPKDATGKRAVAEGVLEVKTLSQEEADHLAEDAKDPSLKEKKQELRLEASALEMRS